MGPYGGMPPHPDPGYFASPAQFPFPHPRVVTQTTWSGPRGHPPSRSQSSGRLGSGRSSWETSRASSQTSSQGVAPAGPQAPATPSPRAGKAADTNNRAGHKKNWNSRKQQGGSPPGQSSQKKHCPDKSPKGSQNPLSPPSLSASQCAFLKYTLPEIKTSGLTPEQPARVDRKILVARTWGFKVEPLPSGPDALLSVIEHYLGRHQDWNRQRGSLVQRYTLSTVE
jgi:hypothetical protein